MGSTNSEGTSAALNQSRDAYNKYTGEYDKWGNQYNQYRQQADQAWQNDFGANAADFTKKQNRAGIQQANQLLDAQSRGATAQAQKASRSAGLGKGQAALNAADITNQTFQAGYAPAVQAGRENYAGAVNANQNQLQSRMGNSIGLMGNAANQATTATGQTAQIGAQQMSDWDKNWGIASGIGGMVSGLGMMSDERKKRDKKPTGEFVHRLHKLGDRLGIQRDFDDLDFRDLNLGNNKQTPPTKADRERKDQERKYWSDMNAMRGSDERIKEKEEQPDMVAEVAENIKNYLYRYKPGSGEDPSVEYSGPMAQDLLQVDGYRSAVFEDENGLLRVDTGRLALVNAGLIADISARLILLETLIREVMEALPQMEEQIIPDVE